MTVGFGTEEGSGFAALLLEAGVLGAAEVARRGLDVAGESGLLQELQGFETLVARERLNKRHRGCRVHGRVGAGDRSGIWIDRRL